MKNYNEMADSVFRRIGEYKAAQKRKRKIIAGTVIPFACACLVAFVGFGIRKGGQPTPVPSPGASGQEPTSGTADGSVFIPAMELPKNADGAMADMIALVVYNGNIYTGTASYSADEAEKIAPLLGDRLGFATGEIDEWSKPDAYRKEFASTCYGDVYAVQGYSTDFRLCVVNEYEDEGGRTAKHILFLDRLNGITLSDGEDLFGNRLGLRGRIVSVQYQTHDDWNNGKNNRQDLSGVTNEQIAAFVEDLYAGTFEDAYVTYPDIYQTPQAHLYLQLDDSTVVELRLIEGGYAGYDSMGWIFVKIPGEAFDTVFRTCK